MGRCRARPKAIPRTFRLPPQWPSTWQLGTPDLVVQLPDYTLKADGLDTFRNFVVPIPGGATRYVRGLEFRPGTTAIHHANIRVDETPASKRMDDADPEPGYEGIILNSAEYPDGNFLGWTPGQVVPLAPKGLAWTLAPGSDFVVQLHMRPTGKPEHVRPSIALYFTNDAPTEHPTMIRMGRQNIDIPAGDADYHSIDSYTLTVDAQVLAIQPHSHYRATSVKAWAALPDHSVRWLINIPRWDFAWQDVYRYTNPFWLPGGTTIFTEFQFDNSATNTANPESPPKQALWGFHSSDEMADVWIQVLTRNAADRSELRSDFRVKADLEDITGYETRIRVEPPSVALHNDVAVLYLEIGQATAAIPHFEEVVRLDPRSSVARFNLGTALERANRMDDAASRYREAIGLDASYAPAHINLGNLLLRANQIAPALAEYQEAVRANPGNAIARNNLGRVLLAVGREDEAAAEIREALRLNPAYAEAHFNMGEVLLPQAGKGAEAAEHYRQALAVQPDWAPGLVRLSWLLATDPDSGVRNAGEAVRLGTRAVQVTRKSSADALDALAAAYASSGQFEEAAKAEESALAVAANAATGQSLEMQTRLDLYKSRRPFIRADALRSSCCSRRPPPMPAGRAPVRTRGCTAGSRSRCRCASA